MKNLIKYSQLLLVSFILFATVIPGQAQFEAGTDMVSRYLWRGQLLASSPAFQPYVSYSTEKDDLSLEVGAWGSYSFTGGDGTEADVYFSLGYDDFSIGFTDYFFPSDAQFAVKDNYFDYNNHVLEFNASYNGPVSVSFNYNLSGDSDAENEDLNSIYTELGYAVNDQLSLKLAGGNGWYTDDEDFGIVMLGVTVTREILFSESFSLPVFGTVGINPSLEKFYIVFGMSF